MIRNVFLFLGILVLAVFDNALCQAQSDPNTGGFGIPRGLITKTDKASEGCVYFSPLLSSTTYLINMDGEVVHTWESEFGPSGWVYLKENGNLLRGGRDPLAPKFGGGGQGGWIQEFTWDGDLVWNYRLANDQHLAHHDVAVLPNGNILAIAWEEKTVEEALQAGRTQDRIPAAGVWPDVIFELQPRGDKDAEIVWEWHIWDHLIQHVDDSKDNFGDPSKHPELLDINLQGPVPPPITQEEIENRKKRNQAVTNSTPENRGSDIYHTNAINYNEKLDQIIMSSPDLNEIFVIDHSTTSSEAAGHIGGRWGRGGDFLYRWGNPENYGHGDSTDQILGGQHDVQWIPAGYPGGGNMLVFNNNVSDRKGFSAVLELNAEMKGKEYVGASDGVFGPSDPAWSFMGDEPHAFFAPFISGAHRMKNGHTFVTEGPKGRFMEVTTDGEVVWDYMTPYAGYVRMPDGTTPQPIGPFEYAVFRATHIPTDHPALSGKSLKPIVPQPDPYTIE